MKRTSWIGLALVSIMALAVWTAPAAALEAKLSGQVNQMVMWADDGPRAEGQKKESFFVTDNDASSTRLRFAGVEDLGGVKAGVEVEIEAQRNPSNRLITTTTNDNAYVGNTGGEDNNGFEFQDRWLNVYFDTDFGKIEIGKGDTAANNTAEMDLSGTNLVTYSDVNTSAGSFVFKNGDGSTYNPAGSAASSKVSDTRNNFDGALSRAERLRYNTPKFAGAYGAVSAANGGAWDTGLFYAADIYGKLAAAVGYTNPQDQFEGYTQWAGSVSWLAPFGLNITYSYGARDNKDRDDASSYYLKVGYLTGIHAVSVEYSATADLQVKGDTSSNWGATYVIKPWKPTELYVAWRLYNLDAATGSDPQGIQQVMAGTRIKF